jgi:hypothetical protein
MSMDVAHVSFVGTVPQPSSGTVSQSSSHPLPHTSSGPQQAPQEQLGDWQICVPAAPQALLHELVVPSRQPNDSSVDPSQSSSAPLHSSVAVTAHEPHVQSPTQVCVPAQPPETTQPVVAPRTHANPSSLAPSQSSSAPLQMPSAIPLGEPVWQAVSKPAAQEEARLPAAHTPGRKQLEKGE